MTDIDPVEIAKKLKIKALSNLIKRANAGDTLSPADLKVLDELQREFGEKKEPEPAFENRTEALGELKRRGYKLGKSKFYKDCAAGLCKVEPDGSVLESSLNRYIKHPRSGLKRLEKIKEEATAKEKTQAEIEKLKTQVRILQHDLAVKEGRYISREDFEMELASVVGHIQTSLENMFEMRAPDWIALVGGDAARTQDLIDAGKQGLEDRFNDLAKIDRFKVVFEIEAQDRL